MAAATAALVAEAAAANDDDVAVIVCLLFSGGHWCRRHRYAAQSMPHFYIYGRKKINKSRQEYRKFLIMTMICIIIWYLPETRDTSYSHHDNVT